MFAEYTYAYVGPGIGGGILAATIGIVAAFFIGIFGVIYFPVKRAIMKRKNKGNKGDKEKASD